jgi:hypothetical protein
MAISKIKISELPLVQSLVGLYTIGVDALNRSVKVSLEFIKTAVDGANDAATAANNAATAANNAKTATEAATGEANIAAATANAAADRVDDSIEAATTAAAAAGVATGAANDAATVAANAAGTAINAAGAANTATTNANNAATTANTAAGNANNATTDANNAAQAANSAATAANEAATNATNVVSDASGAAGDAAAAAIAANNAASLAAGAAGEANAATAAANTATTNANNAATTANTAAGNADTATSAANTAATAAGAAAGTANAAAGAANTAAEAANDATDAANTATANAEAAATAANAAAEAALSPVAFTEAGELANINSEETTPTIFGKLKKWFSSFGALAWKSKVDYNNDIDNLPVIPSAQIQSDYAQSDTSAKDYIKNKPAFKTVFSEVLVGTGDITPALIKDVRYDPLTGDWTFEFIDGTADKVINVTVDNFLSEADYDPETHILTLTMTNGNEVEVDLFDLLKEYKAAVNGGLEIVNGNEFKIKDDLMSVITRTPIQKEAVLAVMNWTGEGDLWSYQINDDDVVEGCYFESFPADRLSKQIALNAEIDETITVEDDMFTITCAKKPYGDINIIYTMLL